MTPSLGLDPYSGHVSRTSLEIYSKIALSAIDQFKFPA
jgi:hypothetical protein